MSRTMEFSGIDMKQNKKRRSKIFFGWWTLLVTGTVSGAGIGFYCYGISVLFKPIALELGLSRAATSGAAGIGMMVGSLLAPALGWVVDRFGPRSAVFGGLFMTIFGLTLMNFINSTLGFYLVWGLLIGVGIHLGLTIAIDKALTNWFQKRIGLVMGTKFALIGLISAVTLPSVSCLVSKAGWRTTCLIWAVIMFLGTPLIAAFVSNKRPEDYGLLMNGDTIDPNEIKKPAHPFDRNTASATLSENAEISLRQAMRTRAYWILSLSFSIQLFIMAGFNTHCIPFLTEMNIDPIIAGGMMGIMIMFTIPSRFISGLLSDWVINDRLKRLLGMPFFFQAIGIGVFLANQASFTIYLLLVLYGIAHGLPTPLLIVITNRYFGRKAFGSIFGTFFLFSAPWALLSPIFTGWVFDKTGNYFIAFVIFELLCFLGITILAFLKPPNISIRAKKTTFS